MAVSVAACSVVLSACGGSGGGADTQTEGPGEARAEARQAITEVSLPPGKEIRVEELNIPNGLLEKGTGRSAVEFRAMCEWYRYYLAASKQQDPIAKEQALAGIRAFPTYSSYSSGDPTFVRLIDGIAVKLEFGDPSEVTNFVEANCSG